MITLNSIRSDVKIPTFNTQQWEESLISYKNDISSLFDQLGHLKIRLLDVNTQNQLCHFSDLLLMYDQQLHQLFIDLFLTDQDVNNEKTNNALFPLDVIQKSLSSLIEKIKAFGNYIMQLKLDFSLFWEQNVAPVTLKLN